jgi:malonate-semialdehyde dehydrogenase (acetylating)/methylmalonate-semialdehyde dehydrogenase
MIKEAPDMPTSGQLPNYINGEWHPSKATEYSDVFNPSTAEVLARVPLSTEAEVAAVVEAAVKAFPEWRRTPPEDRIQYLFKFKQLLEENFDDIARITTTENGKTLVEAQAELRRGVENVEVACGIPTLMQGYNLEDVASSLRASLSMSSIEARLVIWRRKMSLRFHVSSTGTARNHSPPESCRSRCAG